MDWTLFRRIVDELGALDYAGWLAFHNYNEPLLKRRLLDEIGYVRATVPAARPAIYTNGDLLNLYLLDRLVKARVAYIRVTRYPRRADTPPSFEVLRAWLRWAGLADDFVWDLSKVRQGLAAVIDAPGLRVGVISPGIIDTCNARGGTITILPILAKPRTEPGLMTATSVVPPVHLFIEDYEVSLQLRPDVTAEEMLTFLVPDAAAPSNSHDHRRPDPVGDD